MMTNVGAIDRILRLGLGILLIAWAEGRFGPPIIDRTAIGAMFAVGAALTFTGLYRFCPVYAMLGIRTGADGDTSRRL